MKKCSTAGAEFREDSAPRYKVVYFRVPVEIGKVRVNPGEIEEVVFTLALEKARSEKLVKKSIETGMSACAAFEQFGIM